jgi:hypothetical protein
MSNELIGGRVIRSCALVIVREGKGEGEGGEGGKGFVERSQERVMTYQLVDNITGNSWRQGYGSLPGQEKQQKSRPRRAVRLLCSRTCVSFWVRLVPACMGDPRKGVPTRGHISYESQKLRKHSIAPITSWHDRIEMTSTFPKTYSEVTDEHARSAFNGDGLRKSGPKMEGDAEIRGDGRTGVPVAACQRVCGGVQGDIFRMRDWGTSGTGHWRRLATRRTSFATR